MITTPQTADHKLGDIVNGHRLTEQDGALIWLPVEVVAKPKKKKWPFIAIGAVAGAIVLSTAINGANSDDEPKIETGPAAVAEAPSGVEATAPVPEPEMPAEPSMTLAQQNAVGSAESYLAMSGFSRTGLIEQLEYEEFSNADATFAVDTIAPDWNAEAAESAKAYLDMTAFSRGELYDQLVYEGFTDAEANAGLAAVGY
jgi:Host cell surface-exposed lipoprotein